MKHSENNESSVTACWYVNGVEQKQKQLITAGSVRRPPRGRVTTSASKQFFQTYCIVSMGKNDGHRTPRRCSAPDINRVPSAAGMLRTVRGGIFSLSWGEMARFRSIGSAWQITANNVSSGEGKSSKLIARHSSVLIHVENNVIFFEYFHTIVQSFPQL